jgi:hypothetical protein
MADLIHIRTVEHKGVTFNVEYDPDEKDFVVMLPFKRTRLVNGWEGALVRKAREEIEKRERRSKRGKPKITFFGTLSRYGNPGIYAYEGVNLNDGKIIVKDEEGIPQYVDEITIYPASEQGRLMMAVAQFRAAQEALAALRKEHGKTVRLPYVRSSGNSDMRRDANLAAEGSLTKALRGVL